MSAFVRPFENRWLWASIAAAVALQLAVLYVPALQRGFGTVALSAGDWAISMAVTLSVLVARSAESRVPRA